MGHTWYLVAVFVGVVTILTDISRGWAGSQLIEGERRLRATYESCLFAGNRATHMNHGFRYAECYCEENIWHLGQESAFANYPRKAVFISNDLRRCIFFRQRASRSPELPIAWDYHVLLICRDGGWRVWDLDTVLSLPTALTEYLDLTFGHHVNAALMPYFRVIDFEEFRAKFSSDRSHMRDSSGRWIAPPPAWPAIGLAKSSNLFDFIEMKKKFSGTVMSLHDFRISFGESPRRDVPC